MSNRSSGANIWEETHQYIIGHIDKRYGYDPIRDIRILHEPPDSQHTIKVRKGQSHAAQAGVTTGVQILYRHKHKNIPNYQGHEIDPRIQSQEHQINYQKIPKRWTTFEEVGIAIGLGLRLSKLISGSQQDRDGRRHFKTLRQQIWNFDQQQRRYKYIVQIIDDVIKQTTIHLSGIFLHVEPARQHPIKSIYEHGDDHIQDG